MSNLYSHPDSPNLISFINSNMRIIWNKRGENNPSLVSLSFLNEYYFFKIESILVFWYKYFSNKLIYELFD